MNPKSAQGWQGHVSLARGVAYLTVESEVTLCRIGASNHSTTLVNTTHHHTLQEGGNGQEGREGGRDKSLDRT